MTTPKEPLLDDPTVAAPEKRRMLKDFKVFLWSLKLGALVNLYFLGLTLVPPLVSADPHVVIPARVVFAVSAFRCLFPVRYKDNIVFHASPLSSIFLTRTLATFTEAALIYQLAYVIRLLNIAQAGWVEILSWGMVVQVIVSQCFVWGAILTGRLKLYYYEELGWAIIYAANTIASIYLLATVDNFGGKELLLYLNLLFGAVYLPWQVIHLRVLRLNAQREESEEGGRTGVTRKVLARGLHQSIHLKNQTSESKAWGGLVGVIWMASYWAILIPVWVYQIVRGV
ncbi:hypothetical protein ACFLZW_00065 [Chloroflexota bacterium]